MFRSRSLKTQLASLATINLLVLALVFSFVYMSSHSTSVKADGPIKKAALGNLKPAVLNDGNGNRTLPFFSGGILDGALSVLKDESPLSAEGVSGSGGVSAETLGCSDRNPFHDGSVRVNQDCTYRRQAEESISANPVDPRNLIGGQNDSRIGFNHCGFDYSFNGGRNWGDGLPPFWQRLNNPQPGHTIADGPGTNHTYDFASDPGVTFDSQGNAFFSCVVVDVNDNASGLLVTASPAAAHGSFYNNVPSTGSTYVVVEDNSPTVLHDKPFIRADFYENSPFRDHVYAVWTVFKFGTNCIGPGNPGGYCESPIFFSRSTNHAVTWSQPQEISGVSPLCFFGNAFNHGLPATSCNFDQGADITVLPTTGRIVVTFNNGNTAANNPNSQQLAVHSDDGGVTWSQPVKVGDDVTVGEPQCDFGRGPEECVPGPFIRTNDFPRISVHTLGQSTLYVVWQDYKSTHEYDIEISQSTDGGETWTEATAPVNQINNRDHYEPAVDVASNVNSSTQNGNGNGHNNVAVSYYRSPQPRNQSQVGNLGQEYWLAGGSDLHTPYAEELVAPMTPPPDGIQAGFNGDYSGLIVVGTQAHPIWSDTRNAVPASVNTITPQGVKHDEDIFTISMEVPGP